ncbi:MAG TPA: hypothetical protein VF691_17710 [Cytophagaceae bacterium]|jgi:hypothetical protein
MVNDTASERQMSFNDHLINFYIKWRHWEYWPMEIVYLPIFFYYLWLSFISRSFFYFSAANPSIETGGMAGESKWDILKNISGDLIPATVFIKRGSSLSQITSMLRERKIGFPCIAKPDIGERGRQVEKINDQTDLQCYAEAAREDFIIQEYITFPFELGIFYYRMPSAQNGKVTSIVIKEFLSVVGDGQSTMFQLLRQNPRARLQMNRFLKEKRLWLSLVPNKNEYVQLEPIGNHCRGTKFIDGNDLKGEDLDLVFDAISKTIPGFYYGRYDIKCTSLEELRLGKGIKIMELNGVGAEPSHIYHPGFPLWKAYKTLFHHWKMMYKISQENHRLGYGYMSLGEGLKKIKQIKRISKTRKTWRYSGI